MGDKREIMYIVCSLFKTVLRDTSLSAFTPLGSAAGEREIVGITNYTEFTKTKC